MLYKIVAKVFWSWQYAWESELIYLRTISMKKVLIEQQAKDFESVSDFLRMFVNYSIYVPT